MSVHTHTCRYMNMYACICKYAHAHLWGCEYKHICLYMHAYVYVCVCVFSVSMYEFRKLLARYWLIDWHQTSVYSLIFETCFLIGSWLSLSYMWWYLGLWLCKIWEASHIIVWVMIWWHVSNFKRHLAFGLVMPQLGNLPNMDFCICSPRSV